MTYGPPVVKQCEYCKKEYKCPNHRAHKSRFCSITCHNKSGLLERIKYKCIICNDKFMARPDHGRDRKYCSRECFLENSVKPADKECENCGGIFTATRSSTATRGDGLRLYCSKKCHVEGSRLFEEKPCVVCGTMFYPLGAQKNETQKTCSIKCRAEFFSGVNCKAFKGGAYLNTQANHTFVLVGRRKGYASKYTAEHRIVCAKQIGRMLERGEVVIHINNQSLDNRPENLFLCGSMSEYARRRQGSLPWPNKSNLKNTRRKHD
jgi:hypothetical protein